MTRRALWTVLALGIAGFAAAPLPAVAQTKCKAGDVFDTSLQKCRRKCPAGQVYNPSLNGCTIRRGSFY